MVVWSAAVFILAQAVTIGTRCSSTSGGGGTPDAALQTQAKSLATTNADLERANLSLIAEMQERRQAEEQLRQAQKIEAVGRLAGGIAHDFNNLLTVIASYSELALDSLPEDHPLHAQLVEIKRASERAALAHAAAARIQPQAGAAARGRQPQRRRHRRRADAAAPHRRGRRAHDAPCAGPAVGHGRSGTDRAGDRQPGGERARRHAATAGS